jgi:hypothetical protein
MQIMDVLGPAYILSLGLCCTWGRFFNQSSSWAVPDPEPCPDPCPVLLIKVKVNPCLDLNFAGSRQKNRPLVKSTTRTAISVRRHALFRIRFSVLFCIRFRIRLSVQFHVALLPRLYVFPENKCLLKISICQYFGDRGRLVLDGKSDRESDGDPICMQIGRGIGCKNVRVDGP